MDKSSGKLALYILFYMILTRFIFRVLGAAGEDEDKHTAKRWAGGGGRR